MKFSFLPVTIALLTAATLLACVAGCAKKVTTADASYTTLEGQFSPKARMYVWPEVPDTIVLWRDTLETGPAKEGQPEYDYPIGSSIFYRSSPSILHMMLLDATPASGYQFFRKAPNGGFEQMTDYIVNASRKWLNSEWEVYETTDPHPSGYSPATYVGRGVVSGVASVNSPLSNQAKWSLPLPKPTIAYAEQTLLPVDSLFNMSWTPAAGAAGYWIHVYQFTSKASAYERRQSGTPSPIWNGNVKDYFVGYATAPTTSYKLGTSDPSVQVLSFTAPVHGQQYLVRVTAVDDLGRVIAYMHGTEEIAQGDGTYERVPLAAYGITPTLKK